MALPATDAFTAADSTALTTYSANWTYNNGTFAITTNSVRGSSASNDSLAHWNADAFASDQYSQVVLAGTPTADNQGTAARIAASAFTGYALYSFASNYQLYKISAGSFTLITTGGSGPAAGKVLKLAITGTSLNSQVDGVNIWANQTDSAISSGSAGIAGYTNQTAFRLDNWEGGNIGGGASAAWLQRNYMWDNL